MLMLKKASALSPLIHQLLLQRHICFKQSRRLQSDENLYERLQRMLHLTIIDSWPRRTISKQVTSNGQENWLATWWSNPISRRNRDWRCCCLDGSSTAQFESIREPGSPSKSILEKHACNIGKDHWYVASSWIWFGSQVSVNGFKHVRLQHDLQFTVPPGQSVYTYRGKRRCVSFSLRWIAPWSG